MDLIGSTPAKTPTRENVAEPQGCCHVMCIAVFADCDSSGCQPSLTRARARASTATPTRRRKGSPRATPCMPCGRSTSTPKPRPQTTFSCRDFSTGERHRHAHQERAPRHRPRARLAVGSWRLDARRPGRPEVARQAWRAGALRELRGAGGEAVQLRPQPAGDDQRRFRVTDESDLSVCGNVLRA